MRIVVGISVALAACTPAPKEVAAPVSPPARCAGSAWGELAGDSALPADRVELDAMPPPTGATRANGGRLWPDVRITDVTIVGDPDLAASVRPLLATAAGLQLPDAPLAEDVRRAWALGVLGDARYEVTFAADGAHVAFVVTPRPRIERVDAGPAPELSRLRALAGGAFEPLRILRMAKAVEDAWRDAGYADGRVEVRRARGVPGVQLCVAAERGPLVTVSAIRFPGAHAVLAPELLEALGGLHVGAPVQDEYLQLASLRVSGLYWDRGYAEVHVADAKLVRHGHEVEVEIAITEGEEYFLGKVSVRGGSGNVALPAGVAPGDRFSRTHIADARAALETSLGGGAQVLPLTKVDRAAHRIDLTFEIQPKAAP